MATSWNLNFPSLIQNTSGTSVVYSGSINQSGIVYMSILPEASGAPSAAQIIAQTNASGGALPVGAYASGVVPVSGSTVLLSGFGLTSETDYTAYFIASGYVDGVMADVHDTNFTTPDVTGPSWAVGYPLLTPTANVPSQSTVSLKLAEIGSGFFVVVPSGSTVPSAAQVAANTDSNNVAITTGLWGSGTLSANTVKNLDITALQYGQLYTIHVTAKDATGNFPSVPVVSTSFRAAIPHPGAPSNFYSAKNAADRRRRGMVTGTVNL